MKSFLVDALRQADGGDESAAEATEPKPELPVLDVEDAGLHLDTPVASKSAEDSGLQSNDSDHEDSMIDLEVADCAPIEAESDSEQGAESMSLEVESGTAAPLSEIDTPVVDAELVDEPANDDVAGFQSTGAVAKRIPLSRFERLTRLLPLVCLFAFGVGVAGQIILTRLMHSDLNANMPDASGMVSEPMDSANIAGASSLPAMVSRQRVEPALQAPVPVNQTLNNATGPAAAVVANASDLTRTTTANLVKNQAASQVDDEAFLLVDTAFEAYQRGALDEALSLYESALLIVPNHREALSGLAVVHQRLGDDMLALPLYEQLLLLEPGNVQAASEVLSIRSQERGWESESEIRHLIQRFPEAHRLHFSLANLLAERGRWADARHAYYEAYSIHPGVPEYSYNLAVSLEALGDLESARAFYEIALADTDSESSLNRELIESRLDALAPQAGESS